MKRPTLQTFGAPSTFPEDSLRDYLPGGARKAAPEPALPPTAAMAAFLASLDRLEETVDGETALLEAHRPADLEEINSRKSRSLLEITRLVRALPVMSQAGLRPRLLRLQEKLLRNQAVLQLNLDAVHEIAGLLLGVLGEAESDGTYDVASTRRGAA